MNFTASLLLSIASVFVVCGCFPDAMTDSKWYAFRWTFVIVGVALCLKELLSRNRWQSSTFEMPVVIVCTAQALLFFLQKANIVDSYGEFTCGSFDNAAAFASCLCFSFPLGWNVFQNIHSKWKYLFVIAKLTCIIALICSGSRTGVFCVFVWLAYHLFSKKRKWLMLIVPLFFMVLLLVKSDSSRGRWFILERSAEMVSERPVFGWGHGGFKAHYMDTQADYFSSHPESEYSLLADNIHHPLNEYMAVAVDYGLIGVAFLLIITSIIAYYSYRHPSEHSYRGVQLIIMIGIFSFFSYPFQYPFTWMILVYALLLVYYDVWRKRVRKLAICVFPILLLSGYQLYSETFSVLEWGKAQHKALCGLSERAKELYERLYPTYKNNYRFLYGYAATLYDTGDQEKAARVASECGEFIADYDLCLLQGYISKEKGKTDEALRHFERAHLMCPSRLTPVYEAYLVYKSIDDKHSCDSLRRKVSSMRIKVRSQRAEKILNQFNLQNK